MLRFNAEIETSSKSNCVAFISLSISNWICWITVSMRLSLVNLQSAHRQHLQHPWRHLSNRGINNKQFKKYSYTTKLCTRLRKLAAWHMAATCLRGSVGWYVEPQCSAWLASSAAWVRLPLLSACRQVSACYEIKFSGRYRACVLLTNVTGHHTRIGVVWVWWEPLAWITDGRGSGSIGGPHIGTLPEKPAS